MTRKSILDRWTIDDELLGEVAAKRAAEAAQIAPPPERSVDQRKFNPNQPRDPHSGEWSIGGAIKDVLKLLGKIDLGKDEHLVGSGKVDADFGGARFALIGHGDGHTSWRLGFGTEGFGQRNRDDGIPAWDGNPTGVPMEQAEHDRLDAEYDALDDEYDTATPARQAEITARQDDIREQMTAGEGEFNQTGRFDDAAVGQLAGLGTFVDQADRDEKTFNDLWDEIERLEAEADPPTVRIAALKAQADAFPSRTYAEGTITGTDWGDIHYTVEMDDPSVGARIYIGVLPKGDPEWSNGRDWQGGYTVAEWRKLMRQIEAMRAAMKRRFTD